MNIEQANLPRVTYTNTASDFEPLQKMMDAELPRFRQQLGAHWSNRIEGRNDDEGTRYECRSPIDRRLLLATGTEPSPAAIRRAVAAARRGADVWGQMRWQERVVAMRRFARVLDAHKYKLAMAVLYETGKMRLEALGETEEAVALIEHYCDQMEANNGFIHDPVTAGSGEKAQVVLRPYGVFAVISPFNYPTALVAGMVGAALVTGNAVILKASPQAVLTAGMFTAAVEEAKLPPGTFNLLCGEASGPLLVNEPGIDGVAFTGSYKAGMSIMRQFASGVFMRPVLAEMGGKNPAYVSRSADVKAAVEGVARSAFSFQGQKCSACSVAYVHESHYEPFVAALVERAAKFKAGSAERRDVSAGPLINDEALKRYEDTVAYARKAGRVIAGGKRLTGGEFEHGNFVEPTIVVDLPEDDRLFKEELFAPILAVTKFSTLESAIKRGNAAQYGLTAGFYGKDKAEIDYFQDHVESGVLYINRSTGATTGAWPGLQSFCGWKGSGLSGKGGLGPYYLPQFMREQSRTARAVE